MICSVYFLLYLFTILFIFWLFYSFIPLFFTFSFFLFVTFLRVCLYCLIACHRYFVPHIIPLKKFCCESLGLWGIPSVRLCVYVCVCACSHNGLRIGVPSKPSLAHLTVLLVTHYYYRHIIEITIYWLCGYQLWPVYGVGSMESNWEYYWTHLCCRIFPIKSK